MSIPLCLKRELSLYAKGLIGIPFIKKNEIEKIVKELLLVGSIRNSSGPFTSHVLLVKKADGSWRMCIDYKALNSIIVKDNFQSQLLMSCWMNCMGLLLFPS